jgi:hypothetical protein
VPDFGQQDTSEIVLHRPRSSNIAGAKSPDDCELLLAELEARRVRLEKLLHSVWLEADGVAARRVPIRPRARCSQVHVKRTA